LSRRYDFHGVTIGLTAAHEPWVEAVGARLAGFPAGETDGGDPDVRIELHVVATPAAHAVQAPPSGARRVYDAPVGSVVYDPALDVLSIDVEEKVRGRCDPRRGLVELSVLDREVEDLWFLSRPMVTIPLVEILKRHGLYSVHASGVAADGRAIVLAGPTGSGKSTLATMLALEGFGFLADDMVFLREQGQALHVLPFADEIDLSDATFALLPKLGPPERGRPAGWPKHRIRPETVVRLHGAACEPGLLILPQLAEDGRTRLEPAPAEEALLELAPNVLLTDVPSSQAHLDALAGLTRQSRCYRLSAGRDLHEIVERIRSLCA
jgi:hypothetical protein